MAQIYIDYLYETSSVLRKATETEISGLIFWLHFGFLKTEPKFGLCTSLVKLLPVPHAKRHREGTHLLSRGRERCDA